jgi:hypothetical protein
MEHGASVERAFLDVMSNDIEAWLKAFMYRWD